MSSLKIDSFLNREVGGVFYVVLLKMLGNHEAHTPRMNVLYLIIATHDIQESGES